MDSDLVRYSRAGDKFHYRWAARRCLRMINPISATYRITIEGSSESALAGEFGIDIAEYSNDSVCYYQLKHATKRASVPFSFSEIEDALKHFAARFSAMAGSAKGIAVSQYCFVSNRPVDVKLKACIAALGKSESAQRKLVTKLEKATQLSGESLRAFCSTLSFLDGEGDYVVQKEELQSEVAEYIAGFIDSSNATSLVEMVNERALPNSTGVIVREDVLKRLGVNSVRDLFPAPPNFESLGTIIGRNQLAEFVAEILKATAPLVIHAPGGVGKSVVARRISEALPKGSIGIVYDCFGGGTYRNESSPRHRACDALVQIANELASLGLCNVVIATGTTPRDAIFRMFKSRISEACESLREIDESAVLVILMDAADNAEMAAQESSEPCFASGLLREELHSACRIVALCRTERISLLKPTGRVRKLSLQPFDQKETMLHLLEYFPDATCRDASELHRLTAGNPRVQANALSAARGSVSEMLGSLGPLQTTVDEQIHAQLDRAIQRMREQNTALVNSQIEAICRGLSNLPPFIPLQVLAKVARVEIEAIQSFVSDLGRPLWSSDSSVHFRDEPTESWFRERFSADPEEIGAYAATLTALASSFTYVAKALPRLYLRAGEFARLISLALSDDLLPTENSIDERDVRVYRLQFAFKAALKQGMIADAIKIAFRAGEEMAGNDRQMNLLGANIDLIALLQDHHRVQEYAYKRLLRGGWTGSENACSASLLSCVADFHGEARSYLRAARNWLQIFFEERKKAQEKYPNFRDTLNERDVVELAWANLNLFGPEGFVSDVTRWRPQEFTLNLSFILIERMVDAERYEQIAEIACIGNTSVFLTLAVSHSLVSVGRFPPKESLQSTLRQLASTKKRILKPDSSGINDLISPAIVSFLESCAHHCMAKEKILAALDFYIPKECVSSIGHDYHPYEGRRTFLRATALRAAVQNAEQPTSKSLLPLHRMERRLDYREEKERGKLSARLDTLLPFFMIRARLIAHVETVKVDCSLVRQSIGNASDDSYGGYEPIAFELPRAYFETLVFDRSATAEEIERFADALVVRTDSKFPLNDRLKATRICHRHSHLASLREPLEQASFKIIESNSSEGPEQNANYLIELARAVLPTSQADAAAYFEDAVSVVSRFGDEVVQRWGAVLAVARRACSEGHCSPEMLYRFVRCAEMVGNTVVREKYWDRADVFRVAVRMNPSGAFAALSRWRERHIGWFDELIKALACEAVNAHAISPTAGWCLSGFRGCNASLDHLTACIEAESDSVLRQDRFEAAIRDIALEKGLGDVAEDLRKLASRNSLDQTKFKTWLGAQKPKNKRGQPEFVDVPISVGPKHIEPRIKKLLLRINLLVPEGISRLVSDYEEEEFPKNWDGLFRECISRIPVGSECAFIAAVINAEEVCFYHGKTFLALIPPSWRKKVSVRKSWPKFLVMFGRRFSRELASQYAFSSWLEQLPMTDDEVEQVKRGMNDALADSQDLLSAGAFFGFASTNAQRIAPSEANTILEFALERFEKHIPVEFADGPWSPALLPTENIVEAYAGFIWSALAAPESFTRWEAAHCVRRLTEAKCENEIAALMKCMKKGECGAFGCGAFPFYRLHAQQYFLIALARAAQEDVSLLRMHAPVFQQIALEGIRHVLIQKYSAEIALTIEASAPGTYPDGCLKRLCAVGSSELAPVLSEIDQPWQEDWQRAGSRILSFAWDFDRYWFPPLGRIFDESTPRLMETAARLAVEVVGVFSGKQNQPDGRDKLWRNENGTSHDHGSYPRVDDYRFYYSYHALMAAAAETLRTKPVIKTRDFYGDYNEYPWDKWVERHSLARSDKRWLSDRRDPSPMLRRNWVAESKRDEWLWGVGADDFFDVIANQNTLPNALTVFGSWRDTDENEWEEIVGVTSAFVVPSMVESLANALRNSERAWEARLPESDDEKSLAPFSLICWVTGFEGGDKRLDSFDPYSRGIGFPPHQFSKSFAERFQMQPDGDKRYWRTSEKLVTVAFSEVWAEYKWSRRDEERAFRSGNRISVDIDFLKHVCTTLEMELVLSIEIARKSQWRYRQTNEVGQHTEPSFKTLIFSSNGIVRDIQKNYQLG